MEACKAANIKHVVVIHKYTDNDQLKEYYNTLNELDLNFTLILCAGDLEKCKDYTFEAGLYGNLDIKSITANENNVLNLEEVVAEGPLKKEDVAALAVQSLQSLDWDKSRVLSVAMNGMLAESAPLKKVDRVWCVNSELLQEKLASIE